MRKVVIGVGVATALLAGCSAHNRRNLALGPQTPADSVRVETNQGQLLGEITETAKVAELVGFVNSLPPAWEVPWYGPPVGRVYFRFYKGGLPVGSFYVGPDFFGRDIHYSDGTMGFFSQPATAKQIEDLGRLVGLNLRPYIDENKP